MSADLLVPQQIVDQSYGLLVYDVPSTSQTLYSKILSRIRRRAIRLNLSVYLFLWSMKDELEQIVEEAKIECPGQNAVVFIAKFDNNEKEVLRGQARTCLLRDIQSVGERLLKQVGEAQEKAIKDGIDFKHLHQSFMGQMKHRLEEAHGLSVLFGLTHEIKYAMEASQKIFAGEMSKLLSERQIHRAAKKAVRSTKKAVKQLGSPVPAPQPVVSNAGTSWSEVV